MAILKTQREKNKAAIISRASCHIMPLRLGDVQYKRGMQIVTSHQFCHRIVSDNIASY
jgi:hypothetical protein